MGKGYRGGKYGSGEAGVKHRLDEKDWRNTREFIGSGQEEYYFQLPNGAILVIRADNWKDAALLAATRNAKRYRKSSKK